MYMYVLLTMQLQWYLKWLGVIVFCRDKKCQPFTEPSTDLQRASLAWVFFSCSQSVCFWQGKRPSGQLFLIMVLLIIVTGMSKVKAAASKDRNLFMILVGFSPSLFVWFFRKRWQNEPHTLADCKYGLLTKRKVMMAGHCPSSFFSTLSWSIKTQKHIQPSWPNEFGQ